MQVKLISHSTAPVDTGLDNLQELIAFCAKVSNPNNQINKETSDSEVSGRSTPVTPEQITQDILDAAQAHMALADAATYEYESASSSEGEEDEEGIEERGGEREEGGAEGDGTASEVEAIEYEIHAEDGQVDEGNLFGNIHDITRLRRKDT